jgi:polygalacturonase
MSLFLFVFVCALVCIACSARILNFEDLGGKAFDVTYETAVANGNLFNATLNAIQPGDVFVIPRKIFTMVGGIKARGIKDFILQIDGTIVFTNDRDTWPKNSNGDVEECIYLEDIANVVFTSTGKGVIDGNGKEWWGAIKFLKFQGDRPRLLHIKRSKNILMENLLLKNSPFWSFYAEDSDGLHIHHTDVDARWTNADYHTLIDLQAFNTDGFDVTGQNVYIHDCNIWNQDDCISVKDGSKDMLFERISCSGLGLVIGSIGNSMVKNITFRDSYMKNTVKGIYMKTRWYDAGPIGETASISDILYQNITMDNPEQFGIWIGPAQQTGQPCSLLWTKTKFATCQMSGYQTWSNIILRDIYINNPKNSPGVLFGNTTNPMQNVIFENVVITNPGQEPWGDDYYYCEGMQGVAIGKTSPVPPCFEVQKKQ